MAKTKKKFNVRLTPVEFEEKVKTYFDITPPESCTFGSLYIHIGVSERVFKAMAQKTEYRDVAEYARMKMMDLYELKLRSGNPTGAIFALKNMGWSDRAEIEMAVEGTVKVEDLLKGGKMRAK